MTPLENYLRLLKPITNALASIGQEIPGEGKEWVEDITNAIEADKFLSESEKTFMLENSRKARNYLNEYNFRYAATSIGRVCSRILEKALHFSQTDTTAAQGKDLESGRCCWHCRHYIRPVEISRIDGLVDTICTVNRKAGTYLRTDVINSGDKPTPPNDYCDKFEFDIPL